MLRLRLPKIGFKGWSLFLWGLVEVIIGLGNLGSEIPKVALDNAHVLLQLLPLSIWFTLWTIAGVLSVVAAYWSKLESAAFFLSTMMSTAFFFGYLFAFILGYGSRAWLSAVLYFIIATFQQITAAWPDPSRKVGVK